MNKSILITVVLGLLLAACSPYSLSGKSYPRHTTMTAMNVRQGNVLTVEEVLVEGHYGIVGTWGGAAVGQAGGRTLGGGSGAHVAGAVGGVIGAVAGQAIEKKLTSERGLEITVEMDNGQVVAIVQGLDERFKQGDRVRVLTGHDGSARVKHL